MIDKTCVSLRCAPCSLDTPVFCYMTSIRSHNYSFFFLLRTIKILSQQLWSFRFWSSWLEGGATGMQRAGGDQGHCLTSWNAQDSSPQQRTLQPTYQSYWDWADLPTVDKPHFAVTRHQEGTSTYPSSCRAQFRRLKASHSTNTPSWSKLFQSRFRPLSDLQTVRAEARSLQQAVVSWQISNLQEGNTPETTPALGGLEGTPLWEASSTPVSRRLYSLDQ